MKNIYLIEKNIFGAIKIYGSIGTITYYYYTKKEAIKKYNQLVKEHNKK